jgi:DNA-binding transcriptional MerR regulator
MDGQAMKIGELSARSGATERMLRYYEQQGLLAPTRTPAGYRTYGEDDVLRVQYIRCMLSSALPSHVIAQALHFLLDEPVSPPSLRAERRRLADTLQVELDALTERIALLDGSRQQLTRLVSDIRGEVVGPPKPPARVEHDGGPVVRRPADPRTRSKPPRERVRAAFERRRGPTR